MGPSFKREILQSFSPYYPYFGEHKLSVKKNQPLGWEGKWPKLDKGWVNWYNGVEKAKKERMEAPKWIGIYDTIQLAIYKIPFNGSILASSLCLWFINCFQFQCGSMSPTVLDICELTSLFPFGLVINPFLTPNREINYFSLL